MNRLEDIVRVSKALSDPTRVTILHLLEDRPLCVCELVALMDRGQPAVSRHLGILKAAGLVENARDGQFIDYSLRRPEGGDSTERILDIVLEVTQRDPDLNTCRSRARQVDRHALREA